jgi:hypothetical protein
MGVKTLRHLMQAFGLTPAAGMSFRVHIPGAASAVGMHDYVLNLWQDWASSDAYGGIAHGTIVHFTFNFSGFPHWNFYLKKTPLDMSVISGAPSDPTISAVIQSSSYFSDDLSAHLAVQVFGRPLYGAYSGGSMFVQVVKNYFKFYTYPDAPTGTQDEDWEITVNSNAGVYVPPGTGSPSVETLIFTYPDDLFNDHLEFETPALSVYGYDAGPAPGAVNPQYEWHNDSAYTSLFSTNETITIISGAGSGVTGGTYYLRYKYHTADSWTNYGPISWHDPRF